MRPLAVPAAMMFLVGCTAKRDAMAVIAADIFRAAAAA